jgi:hypothetical protein
MRRQRDFAAAQFEEFQVGELGDNSHRVGAARLTNFLERRRDSLLATNPDLLEQVIEANFVFRRKF